MIASKWRQLIVVCRPSLLGQDTSMTPSHTTRVNVRSKNEILASIKAYFKSESSPSIGSARHTFYQILLTILRSACSTEVAPATALSHVLIVACLPALCVLIQAGAVFSTKTRVAVWKLHITESSTCKASLVCHLQSTKMQLYGSMLQAQ